MTLFLALPLWRYLIHHRITDHTEIPSIMGEDHVVYLDQDNILLPTVAPPPYAREDPNPLRENGGMGRRGRRPVAVLAVIERVDEGGEGSRRGGDGEGDEVRRGRTTTRPGEGDERRISITLKRRRREFELSLKAVLSVIIFLLAIVGIAWLGSMAVAYTWPPKEELIETVAKVPGGEGWKSQTTRSHQGDRLTKTAIPVYLEERSFSLEVASMSREVEEMRASLSSYRYSASAALKVSASAASSASLSMASSASSALSAPPPSSTPPTSLASPPSQTSTPHLPIPGPLGLSKRIFSPALLSAIHPIIGDVPLYDCALHPSWSDGRGSSAGGAFRLREEEKRLQKETGVWGKYDKRGRYWCVWKEGFVPVYPARRVTD